MNQSAPLAIQDVSIAQVGGGKSKAIKGKSNKGKADKGKGNKGKGTCKALRRMQHSQRSLRRLPLPRTLSSFGLVDKSGSRGGCVGRLAAKPNIPFSRQLALRKKSLHVSRSVLRSRSAHTARPSGPRSRGIFSAVFCCSQTTQQDSSLRGPGRSLSGWTACVPRPLESSEAPNNTQNQQQGSPNRRCCAQCTKLPRY